VTTKVGGTVLPPVSVVIPHLNQPEALARCLASLTAQDYPKELVEVVVVDNGSQQSCADVVASYPGARLLLEPQPGPGPARNTGVAAASNSHLAFIDADCRADSHWLRAAMTALVAAGPGVVGGDVKIDVLNPPRLTTLEAYESVFAYRQQMYIARDGFSGTGNLAMRREVFDKVGPFAGIGIAEDYDWGRRARAVGHPASYCADMIVYHPARTSMVQLHAKWRRHIAHDLAEGRTGGRRGVYWIGKSFAVLASAIPHSFKLLTSPRLRGVPNRLRGIAALFAIRSFRCREMLRQARPGAANAAADWNRPSA
jgi:glycosyltransferase involved in cell wall biosynthesis